jgi:hypothetical protein
MGQITSVFVRGLEQFDVLLGLLVQLLACPSEQLSTESGILHRFMLLDLQIDVFNNHGLVDDCGIRFTKYPFEIDLQTIGRITRDEAAAQFRESLALLIADTVSYHLSCYCLVVDNLQTEIRSISPPSAIA